jgi:hypothetical protein
MSFDDVSQVNFGRPIVGLWFGKGNRQIPCLGHGKPWSRLVGIHDLQVAQANDSEPQCCTHRLAAIAGTELSEDVV